MNWFIFLTVVQAIVAFLLVVTILVQKSEGGGLGTGGSPAGLMSARGAADFITRLTAILATIFVVLSITLAALAVKSSGNREIDNSLNRVVAPVVPQQPVDPLGGAAQNGAAPGGAAALTPVTGATPSASATPAKKP